MLTQITAAELKSKLEQTFLNCGDFNIRAVLVKEQTLYLANLGGYTSRDYISENVIKPVIDASPDFIDDSTFLHVLYSSEAVALANFDEVCNRLLAGFAVIFCDIPSGVTAYACMSRADPGRGVSEPDNEAVVRGPREGFIEKVEDNIAILRKRLRTPAMKVLSFQSGKYSEITVKVVYIEGVADINLVNDVAQRIKI